MTPEQAAAALLPLGIEVEPTEIALDYREGRWLARLPGDRLAWLAETHAAHEAMTLERRVLRLLETRTALNVPRVLIESSDGAIDIRTMIPMVTDPFETYRLAQRDTRSIERLGSSLGATLAELHTKVHAADVAGWLPRLASWPEPREWIRERLPRVVDDQELHAKADALMERYEELQKRIPESDRAFIHTDFGLHNLSIDPASLTIRGVFDWTEACWADRHLDFRYLAFDTHDTTLLDATLKSYESVVGFPLSKARVLLYNAACAISYLAFRAGVPPEQRWAGRTLAEDLLWTRSAMARIV